MKYLTGCLLALLANAAYPMNEYATDPVQIDEITVGFKDGHFSMTVKNGSIMPKVMCGVVNNPNDYKNKTIVFNPDKTDVKTLLPIIVSAQQSGAYVNVYLEMVPCTATLLQAVGLILLPPKTSLQNKSALKLIW